MTRTGLKMHQTRTPRKLAQAKAPVKGKTLQQVREKGHKR